MLFRVAGAILVFAVGVNQLVSAFAWHFPSAAFIALMLVGVTCIMCALIAGAPESLVPPAVRDRAVAALFFPLGLLAVAAGLLLGIVGLFVVGAIAALSGFWLVRHTERLPQR